MIKHIVKSFLVGWFNFVDWIKSIMTNTDMTQHVKNGSIGIQCRGNINIDRKDYHEQLFEDDSELFDSDITNDKFIDNSSGSFPYHGACLECTTNKGKCKDCCCYDSNWSNPMLASETKADMSSTYHNYCIENDLYFIDYNNNIFLGSSEPRQGLDNMKNCILGGE